MRLSGQLKPAGVSVRPQRSHDAARFSSPERSFPAAFRRNLFRSATMLRCCATPGLMSFLQRKLLPVLLLLLPGITVQAKSPSFFRHDLEKAREEARTSSRPLVIFFGGAWCPICRQMREGTLRSPELKAWVEKLIWVEIDLDRKLSLAREFKIRAVPTLIIEAPDGREIRRVVGLMEPAELLSLLEKLESNEDEASAERSKSEIGKNTAILWEQDGYRAGSICFANVGYGPLKLRSQSGFQALRLMMIPRAPSTIGKGGLEFSGTAVWSNLWAVDEKAFSPDDGSIGPYLIDAESLEGNLALSYGLSDTVEIEIGYEFRSHFGGVLDGVIEAFHDFIGVGQQGRDRWPRDQFHFIWNPENGEPTALGPGDSGLFVQNLLLTVQHNISCGSAVWPAVAWWATLRLGLQAEGFDRAPVDGLFGVAFAKRFGDFNAYLSLSEAWYSETTALELIELRSDQGSLMAALEWRFRPRSSLIVQFLLSEGVVGDSSPFDENSKEIILGMKHELRNDAVLEWGLIENFAPFDNSPDVGLHFGYTRRF